MFDFINNSEKSLLIMCNFHIFPVPQGRSSYHISHQNMVINFMWVFKQNINYVNNYIYFKPKNWNNITMKLVNPPRRFVKTLALGLRPRQGFARLRAKGEARESHGNEPSHSQVNSHFGSWSPNGVPNLQRAISGVKTHQFEKFFVSSKTY